MKYATSQKHQWPTMYLLGQSPIDLYVWSAIPIVLCVVRFCFYLGIHTQNFPPKWILVFGQPPKTCKINNVVVGSCKTMGTNTMTSSNKTNYSTLYNIVTKQVSQRTVFPDLLRIPVFICEVQFSMQSAVFTGSVVLLFLKNTNVPQNNFFGLFWPMGSYVACGMRMTVPSIMTQHKKLPNVPYFMNMSEWQENDKKDNWDGHPDPTLLKLDPIWGYFCVSDHNLILDSYQDTHA